MEYYNKIAKGYEELYREEQLKKLDIIKKKISPGLLLDIGCGSGISMELWKCKKIGVDTAFELLKIAKQKGLFVVLARAECLPFKDKQFDIITSITAMHHFNPKSAFREMKRVAKNKKQIVISFPKIASSKTELQKQFTKLFGLPKVVSERKDVILIRQLSSPAQITK